MRKKILTSIAALMAIYKNTINILNSEYIRATIGVKQGGPMSCILFVIYLNVMVMMMKRFISTRSPFDGANG